MEKAGYHHGDLKSALLDAAETVLARDGLERMSLRSIAASVGVSHAAPAYHFGSLRGLLTALAANGFERLAVAMEKARGNAETWQTNALGATGVGYIEFALDAENLFRLMLASTMPDFRDAHLKWAANLAFGKLKPEEREMSADSGTVSAAEANRSLANWSLVHGLAMLLLSGHVSRIAQLDETDRVEAILAIFDAA